MLRTTRRPTFLTLLLVAQAWLMRRRQRRAPRPLDIKSLSPHLRRDLGLVDPPPARGADRSA